VRERQEESSLQLGLAGAFGVAVVVGLLTASVGGAQELPEPNDPIGPASTPGLASLPGVGARALGMGGAFTAIADDATAATWNPAGLAQLTKPEASLVAESADSETSNKAFSYGYSLDEKFREPNCVCGFGQSEDYRETSARQRTSSDSTEATFLSATYPFVVGRRNLVVQVSARRLLAPSSVESSSTISWSDTLTYYQFYSVGDGTFDEIPYFDATFVGEDRYAISQDLDRGIETYSLSVASSLTDKISLGLTVNYNRSTLRQVSTQRLDATYPAGYDEEFNPINGSLQSVEKARSEWSVDTYSFDVGALWRPIPQLRVGAVLHIGTSSDFDRPSSTSTSQERIDPINGASSFAFTDSERRVGTVDWPSGYALGLAFAPLEWWTIAADYSETDWSDSAIRKGRLVESSFFPPDLLPLDESNPNQLAFPSDGPQQKASAIRLGTEARVVLGHGVLPLRAGYSEEDPVVASRTIEDIDSDVYGEFGVVRTREVSKIRSVSAGIGYAVTGRRLGFQVDLAWVRSTWTEKSSFRSFDRFDGLFDFSYAYDQEETLSRRDDVKTDRWVLSGILRF